MKKIAILLLLYATAMFGQTAETVVFRAILSPANETPPIQNLNASGAADLLVHLMRDSSGQIVSGTVDFSVSYVFPGATKITGLHIHRGPAGTAGPITIPTGVSGTNAVDSTTGTGRINEAAQVRPTDQEGLNTLKDMLQDPSQFYANLHTDAFPGGAIRGQLQRAEVAVLMGQMLPGNETPPITTLNASGIGYAVAIATRDSSGRLTSGEVLFQVSYSFPEAVTFTGLHIHTGGAGVAGPVTIPTPIGSGLASLGSDPSGKGSTPLIPVEIPLNNAASVDAFQGLFTHPQDFYINIHTTTFPGGIIRAQLRRADRTSFKVLLLPSNEVPPVTGVNAMAPAEVTVYTLRGDDGSVVAGLATYDVNYRFPDATTFTGLHIHNGAAGTNGPVVIDSGISGSKPVVSSNGFGNGYFYIPVTEAAPLATLNSLLANPEQHYLNLHTTVNPGGVVRAQLGPANTTRGAITSLVSAVLERTRTTAAPGGLITIFGTNLAKVTGDLSGFAGSRLPTSFNGVQVTIAGRGAPLLYVSPTQINAQVPLDTPTGMQPVVVTTGNGPSPAMNITVAAAAPAIFLYDQGGIVVKNADFSLVGPNNAAKAGDILVIYSTGLGQTTPVLSTGALVTFPPQSDTAPVTVSIGGQNAEVIYSIAAPQFAGLYQTAVRMPAGVAAGNAQLILSVGGVSSNAVNIAVQ